MIYSLVQLSYCFSEFTGWYRQQLDSIARSLCKYLSYFLLDRSLFPGLPFISFPSVDWQKKTNTGDLPPGDCKGTFPSLFSFWSCQWIATACVHNVHSECSPKQILQTMKYWNITKCVKLDVIAEQAHSFQGSLPFEISTADFNFCPKWIRTSTMAMNDVSFINCFVFYMAGFDLIQPGR